MKRLILIFFIFNSMIFNTFANSNRSIVCDSSDPTIRRMQEYLAKKDIRTFLLTRLTDLSIEALEDSIDYDIKYRTSWPQGLHISSSILTKFGSHLVLRSSEYEYDENGDYIYSGLSPHYHLREEIVRNNEGQPISRTCSIRVQYPSNHYELINKSYDDYVIEYSSENIFNSTHTYQLSL